MTDRTTGSKISSGSSTVKSLNSVPIQYHVKDEKPTCCSLCTSNLLISCILFLIDVIFEYFIILQWINNQYYIPTITLFCFIILANLGNIFQWYIQFNDYTTFKLCHFIIPFGLIGLLPLFSIIYYVCHSSCCICARIGIFSNEYNRSVSSQRKKKILVKNRHLYDSNPNDISERLLQPHPSHSITSIDQNKQKQNDVFYELLSNITQLLCLQSFIRTVPFVCIQLYVFITAKLEPKNWILTNNLNGIDISLKNIPDLLLINDLNVYYYISISIGLLTYAFITITYLDLIESWQQHDFSHTKNKLLKLFHITFIFCDLIIRTMPIILAFQCKDTLEWYYIVFGLQVIIYLEINIWYEIYQYYPDFPMRKVYPYTYNELYNQYELPIYSSPHTISHIAMQSQNNKSNQSHHLYTELSDHSAQKQYQNPRYISNGSNALSETTILSPVSADDTLEINSDMDVGIRLTVTHEIDIKEEEKDIVNEDDNKIWVLKNASKPKWALQYDEYIAGIQGLLGGVLTSVSGWLIGYTLKHCVMTTQYKICIIELMLRYILSIVLMVIYTVEYHSKLFIYEEMDLHYWIWIVIFVGCILYIMPYAAIIHLIFKPKTRRKRLSQIELGN